MIANCDARTNTAQLEAELDRAALEQDTVVKDNAHRLPHIITNVTGLDGSLCTVTLDSNSKVSDVKNTMVEKTNVEYYAMRLLHGARMLVDRDDVSTFAVHGTVTFTVMQRSEDMVERLKRLKSCVDAGFEEHFHDEEFALEDIFNDAEPWTNPDLVLEIVGMCGWALGKASPDIRADRDVVLAAVTQNGTALRYAIQEHRADRDIVFAALNQSGFALEHASDSLRACKDVVHAAVSKSGCALKYASKQLRGDKEIVRAAVAQDSRALDHACELDKLCTDKDIVLAAVSRNGCDLEYASAELRADKDVVLVAVAKSGCSLRYASRDLRADQDIVRAAVAQNRDALTYALS